MGGGGADTYNMVMPHSECGAHDLYADYVRTRGNATAKPGGQAIFAHHMLGPISVSSQPCNKFGVHRHFPVLRQLYDSGDLAFMANVGPMVEPYVKGAVRFRRPKALYSHNSQAAAAQAVHSVSRGGAVEIQGILNRLGNALQKQEQPFASNVYSIA